MDCFLRVIFYLLPIQLLLLVSLSLASAAIRAENILNLLTLALPVSQPSQLAGYYMAQHKGFFTERGLEVRFISSAASQAIAELVTMDAAEYGVGNSSLLIAKANGADIVAMAAIFQHSPAALLTLKKNAINQPGELHNKRVLLRPELQDIELLTLLNKLQIKSINMSTSSLSRDINALVNNQFDAFSIDLTEGPYHFVRNRVEPVVFMPKDYGIDFYAGYLFTSNNELVANPQRVEAVRLAVLQGWEYALTHTEETLDVIASLAPAVPRSELKYQLITMRDYILPDFIPLGYISSKHLINIKQQLLSAGLIDKDADLSGFVYQQPDNRFDWVRWAPWIMAVLLVVLFNAGWLFYLLVINDRLKRQVLERQRAERRVRHAAQHDHLTGLGNRAKLMDTLSVIFPQARRGEIVSVLLFMDLDRFKAVNDRYGHAAGDELLVAVSQRMARLVREPNDLLVRLGGDEFVVLLADSSIEQAQQLSERIERCLLQSFALSVCNVSIGVSIGYCIYRPDISADEMLTNADNAMYNIKRQHHQNHKLNLS